MSTRALRRGNIARSGALVPLTVNTLSLSGTAGNYASTPDSVANSPTHIEVRVKLTMASWPPPTVLYVASKWSGTTQRAWQLLLHGPGTGGVVALGYSTTGNNQFARASNTAMPALSAVFPHWIRAILQSTTSNFYWSDDYDPSDLSGTWTQIGTTVTDSATNIFNSTAAVVIGAGNSTGTATADFVGNVHYFELWNPDTSTLLHTFDATAVTKIGTRDPSTVAAGGPWTINGSAWDWMTV